MATDIREEMVTNWPDVQKDQAKARQVQLFCVALALITAFALIWV